MIEYLEALRFILEHGEPAVHRNGQVLEVFGGVKNFFWDMRKGFPAVTTKQLQFKSVVAELIWFLLGSTDVKVLNALGSKIWNANAYDPTWLPKAAFKGDVGRNYSAQWRNWQGKNNSVDQITELVSGINTVKQDPTNGLARRLIVNSWNPAEIDQTALPPCHNFFQVNVSNGFIDLQMYQRSADFFLGVPFNIASYGLLLSMLGQVCQLTPRNLSIIFGNAHIYKDHIEAVKEQLKREPLTPPTLWLNPEVTNIFKFKPQDVRLENYESYPAINARMNV